MFRCVFIFYFLLYFFRRIRITSKSHKKLTFMDLVNKYTFKIFVICLRFWMNWYLFHVCVLIHQSIRINIRTKSLNVYLTWACKWKSWQLCWIPMDNWIVKHWIFYTIEIWDVIYFYRLFLICSEHKSG